MAGALMAMAHWNERNTSVVANLLQLIGDDDCSVWFDMNNSFIYDTESITHAAADSLVQSTVRRVLWDQPVGILNTTSPLPMY